MKAKEWLQKNVDFRRDDTEVRDNKGYCSTMAIAGLAVGIVTGVLVIILQLAISSYESQQTWISVISSIAIVTMLTFMIYMLFPLFKNSTIAFGGKIVTTILCLACLIIPFAIGIYAIVLLFIAVVALGVLWLGLKIWGASASTPSTSYRASRDEYGPKSYKLEDGTTVTENSVTSGYHGSDHHDYERNIDGTFSRID